MVSCLGSAYCKAALMGQALDGEVDQGCRGGGVREVREKELQESNGCLQGMSQSSRHVPWGRKHRALQRI